jgi:hypothetical protein
VQQILQDACGGTLNDIRRYTTKCKSELENIIKDFREVHPKRPPKQQATWLQQVRKSLSKATDKLGVKPDQIAADIKSAAGNVLGMLSPTVLGAGGFIGLMLYGIGKTEEIEAESNRFVQIFEESTRSFSRKAEAVDRLAAGKLAVTAKELELNFAATRGELEAVGRAFATAGIAPSEIAEKVTTAYGRQQQTLFGLTLGLERHFELAGGTAAKQASEFITKYGMSTKEAADAVVMLNFAGARSGVGIGTFTNAIGQATAGVRHMGIRAEEVIGLTAKLQKEYEGLGVGKHFAGAEALKATQQIMGGLQGMDLGMQVLLAERLGMGKGLEARARLLEQLTREGGPDTQVLARSVTELRAMALEMSGGDPHHAREWLATKGYNYEGAKAIMEIGGKLGDGLSFEQLSKEEQKALTGSLKTEAQKTEEFQKFITKALDGVRQVGLALFNILTAGLAEIILSVRMVIATLSGDTMLAAAYGQAMRETAKIFPEAIGQAYEGLKDVGKAGEDLLGSVEGLQPMRKALEGVLGGDEETPGVRGSQDTQWGSILAEGGGGGGDYRRTERTPHEELAELEAEADRPTQRAGDPATLSGVNAANAAAGPPQDAGPRVQQYGQAAYGGADSGSDVGTRYGTTTVVFDGQAHRTHQERHAATRRGKPPKEN